MAMLPTQEQELRSAALVASSCTIRVSHLSSFVAHDAPAILCLVPGLEELTTLLAKLEDFIVTLRPGDCM